MEPGVVCLRLSGQADLTQACCFFVNFNNKIGVIKCVDPNSLFKIATFRPRSVRRLEQKQILVNSQFGLTLRNPWGGDPEVMNASKFARSARPRELIAVAV